MNEHQSLAYRREYELLQCCARTRLFPRDVERMERLVQEGVQWEYLLQLSELHGVRSLLQKSLMEVCPDAIPTDMFDQLLHLARATSMHNLFLAKELGRLSSLLEANEIPALALKGPVLAQVAYGDINLRSYGDLDVLVRKEDFDEVQRLLMEDGYTPHKEVSGLQGIHKKLYLWQAGQYSFRRGASVFNVDLHTDIMPPLYYYVTDFETLWQRSEVISIAEAEMRSCEPEDVLQILCYHGAKNRWEALKYICDVAELIRAKQGLDWDLVMRRARQTRGERILFLGLYLAHSLLDGCLPREVLLRVDRERHVKRIAARLLERLPYQMHQGIAGFGERLRFHLAIQDTLATRVRYSYFALLRRVSDRFQPGIEPH